ncbi:MAG: hypothetical protein GX675_01260 [Erysipelotrichaceae bacterium]|nr:hypothetical protein [Erysipelotrichaceae bacterium]
MIDDKAMKYLKDNYIGVEESNAEERLIHTNNDQLKIAIKQCKSRNVMNLLETLADNEKDLDKKAIILGFKNNNERVLKVNEVKNKLERIK